VVRGGVRGGEAAPARGREDVAKVVAIQAGPIDVGITRVQLRVGRVDIAGIDVWAPGPGDVAGAGLRGEVVEVPPGVDVVAGGVAVDARRVGLPVAVHLPVPAQEQGM